MLFVSSGLNGITFAVKLCAPYRAGEIDPISRSGGNEFLGDGGCYQAGQGNWHSIAELTHRL